MPKASGRQRGIQDYAQIMGKFTWVWQVTHTCSNFV